MIIQIETPRTGSTSIRSLRDRFGFLKLQKHRTIKQIKEMISQEAWNKAIVFGTVRHPYSRMSSIYRHCVQKQGLLRKTLGLKFTKASLINFDGFMGFVQDNIDNLMFKPQVFFISEDIRMLKYEFLSRDWAKFLKSIGKEHIKLPFLNASNKIRVNMSTQKHLIDDLYADDFKFYIDSSVIEGLNVDIVQLYGH